tara:strand:+ start:182 stop:673 length:492 start_codon:yes stop_codon:yes gene_type:complete
MSKVDWNDAPSDAEAYIGGFKKWVDDVEYGYSEESQRWLKCSDGWNLARYIDNEYKIEMRPDNWKEGEKRMDPIGQNGNEGEHYAELDNFDKQPRFVGEDGLDHIDEFARDNSIGDFRAAMRFTIGRYGKRLGKKDAMSKELYKMSEYYKRWSEVEKKLEDDK